MSGAADDTLLHPERASRGGIAAWRRYRAGLVALTLSALVHAAIVSGLPDVEAFDRKLMRAYTAHLQPAAVLVPPPQAVPAPAAPRPVRPKSRPRAPVVPELLPSIAAAEIAVPPALATTASDAASGSLGASAPDTPPPQPEVVALAQPTVPPAPREPEKFPVEALPASLSIDYQITSAFADGRATYEWRRDGDSYRISGEAEATGFFTLFLEGRLLQESRGTVGAEGLRPERFRERKPTGAEEGLDFDWGSRQVTFDRGDERKTTPLADNTVDWLSMIFQLAHVPPSAGSVDMQVFTQRKMYKFKLEVLGIEEIEIPMGRVKALHLRHSPTDAREAVDVWLGVEQHHLPVKMRFPVARNRLMVEQVATGVRAR